MTRHTPPSPLTGDTPAGHGLSENPELKVRTQARLRRIEGQVRGLQRMVEEERACAEVLTQIASVHEALRAVGRELLRNHLKHCATTAFRASDAAADAMCDELVDLMYRRVR
jgi:CsoR family transcriptional regulator, copper-sensing transcriptional repressor